MKAGIPEIGKQFRLPLAIVVCSAMVSLAWPAAARQAPSAGEPPASYAGPRAGMMTWTGKLSKDETLTIEGGTPSAGVLSGAGLPGVAVRLVIDQANLAIVESPNAKNGYRRLVLKSHSRHDKIVIHWTVIR